MKNLTRLWQDECSENTRHAWDAKPGNVKAIIDSAKEYGKYK
jgi:hypothetical protein